MCHLIEILDAFLHVAGLPYYFFLEIRDSINL